MRAAPTVAAAGFGLLLALPFLGQPAAAADPQKDDAAEESPEIDPLGPNAACYVCHMTFVHEELSKVHLRENVTCIQCHGLSAGHANDEDIGATPPDVTYKRGQVDASCRECHEEHDVPARKVVARWLERKRPGPTPICTDCHGTHKIEQPEDEQLPAVGLGVTAPAIAALSFAPTFLAAAEPVYPTANKYEEEAIAAGWKLGIGAATLEGPKTAEVMSHQTWTLVYTAGKAGIRPGGGIRIGFRHVAQWSPPQTEDPKGAGYLTVKTSGDVPAKVAIDFRRRYFHQYFAWHNMAEVVLPERGLAPGETIRVTYGDTGGGSPGIRVQPFDERRFVFKVYVDALGEDEYLPLADSPAVEIVAAEADRLGVVMPSDAVAGQATWCIVRAEDRYGNPAPTCRGTIRWESTDPGAKLPARYTFTEGDRGVHRFEGITFRRIGNQTITVTDGAFTRTGNPVRVTRERPERLLLWGDLHGHTLQSDGRGTVEEYYDFAEHFSGLDFCAVSDHAFELVDEMWEHSKAITNGRCKPGRFVTFNGYEWSGNADVGGDHNVYFLDDDPPLYRSDNYYDRRNLQMYHGPDPKVAHIRDLFARLEEGLGDRDVFCVPHWGGRHGNPRWHSPKVQRLVEVFSEHRRSEDWAATFLTQGHRVGVIASTDGHYGNPGYGYLWPTYDWDQQEIGMAAVAVYAAERTRESIFRALYDRRTYATSGERIILDFRADGRPMGSQYSTDTPPVITVEAAGAGPIALVEIKKDGQVVAGFEPQDETASVRWRDEDFRPGGSCYYYVRVIQEDKEEAISSPIWVN